MKLPFNNYLRLISTFWCVVAGTPPLKANYYITQLWMDGWMLWQPVGDCKVDIVYHNYIYSKCRHIHPMLIRIHLCTFQAEDEDYWVIP